MAEIQVFVEAPHAVQSGDDCGKCGDQSTLPRGKKLILKDGTTEIVRDYAIQGDRVRYYSVERSQYEEIPSSLVDWDATHRSEAAEAQEHTANRDRSQ